MSQRERGAGEQSDEAEKAESTEKRTTNKDVNPFDAICNRRMPRVDENGCHPWLSKAKSVGVAIGREQREP